MSLPDDLVQLPTTPWDFRPAELPLDIEECRTAIWMAHGNISQAAEILKVTSGRLRTFVKKSEYLQRECDEAREQILDYAEDAVYQALTDNTDPGRRDSMARFVLPQLGQSRGYGTQKSGVGVTLGGAKGSVTITWDDGSTVVGEPEATPETIDITPRAANAE